MGDFSAKYFFVEPVADTLKINEDFEVIINILNRKNMTFPNWEEFCMQLRLKIIYQYKSWKETLKGGAIISWIK